ncbi:MAG: hypothetical protein AAF378_02105 [Cyanobacteria bacterium P01_A01_bin.84]
MTNNNDRLDRIEQILLTNLLAIAANTQAITATQQLATAFYAGNSRYSASYSESYPKCKSIN